MDALTVAAISMQDDLLRMNGISQNLANVMTTGYKRVVPFSQHMEALASTTATTPADMHIPTGQTLIDPSAGTLRYSGNTMDVAIEGEGYFEVAMEGGAGYTRHGALHVDARGRLVTAQGYPLMGVGGELSVSGSSVTIARNGEVRQGDRVAGQIKLVRFANPERMAMLGNGIFSQGAARLIDTGDSSTLRTGYQENSNVNSPREMTQLAETVRHFESMQKVFQGYDEMMEKAIRQLGEF